MNAHLEMLQEPRFCRRQWLGRLLERLLNLLMAGTDHQMLQILLGSYTFVWGAWLLGPQDTMASNPSYAAMLAIASENAWGACIALLGFKTIVATVKEWDGVQHLNMFLVFSLWLFVSLSVGISSEWRAGGVPHFALMGLFAAWTDLRLVWGSRG